MISPAKWKFSLTKNGYLKTARLLRRHPSHKVLRNVRGTHADVTLVRSQVSKILGADPETGEVPAFWDEIRELGEPAISSFVFAAVILSHHRLIETLAEASTGDLSGCVRRRDLSSKEYTNLVYAMGQNGLWEFEKNTTQVQYDMYHLVFDLNCGQDLLRSLIKSKLRSAGWVDPDQFPHSTDGDFMTQCRRLRLHKVFGLQLVEFRQWLDGKLDIDDEPRGPREPRLAR